jgi:ketosteroid isomerase-like protein
MRCALAPFAVIAALLLAGCAGGGQQDEDSAEDFQGAQQQVAQTVEDLQDATREKDGAKICSSLLSSSYQRSIAATNGGEGCSDAVDDAIKETDPVDLVVTKVEVTGDRATATVAAKSGEDTTVSTDTYGFEKQAGRWKISSTGT